MADHKNQHFVPKIHFKAFSKLGFGKSINLYLIDHDRTVVDAPIKGQCAKHYLYGTDGNLERILGELEGEYGKLIARLVEASYQITDSDKWLLRYFILVQSHRTAEQIDRAFVRMSEMASFFQKAQEAHGMPWDSNDDPTPERAMTELMLSFNEQMQGRVLDDLKVVIVRNRTEHDFVTSDDPAVTTNRWLLQRKKINIFGTNSAGLNMFLPLSPRSLALLYDPAVYSIPTSGSGTIDVVKERDVLALNEHQYMRAVSAIYFHGRNDAVRVAKEFHAARNFRPSRWDRFTVAKRDGQSATHTRYSVGEPDDVAKADAILFHLAREWPQPPRWPSFLRYRESAHGFSKGRVIVRRARQMKFEIGEEGNYYRVK